MRLRDVTEDDWVRLVRGWSTYLAAEKALVAACSKSVPERASRTYLLREMTRIQGLTDALREAADACGLDIGDPP